jgi:hypothetical protein
MNIFIHTLDNMVLKNKKNNTHIVFITVILLLMVIIIFTFSRRARFETMIAFYKFTSLYGTLAWHNRYPIDYPYQRIDDLIPDVLSRPFHHICYHRQITGDNTLQELEMKQCVANIQKYCVQHLSLRSADALPVLYLPEDEDKIRFYVQKRFPFVIRGATWKTSKANGIHIDSVLERYGDTHVMFDKDNETFEGKLRDMQDNKAYLSNSTSFMKKHPEIIDPMDLDRLTKMSGMTHTISQIFMSIVPNNGTPMHSAFSHNFFFMVEGQKRWTFWHPDYLCLTYPYFPKNGIYFASYSAIRDFQDTDILQKYPLLEYAPHYEVVLQEGDVLFNPGPWWHAIRNVTERSLAFATRWVYPDELVPSPYQLQYCQIANSNIHNVFGEIYVNTGTFKMDVDENYSGDVQDETIALVEKMNHDALALVKNPDRHLAWY